MDEAEKYKQRLEAIAEKRRLQEEQDRAKREMEDEKIRLHQLKRKSLRDQWLMEGPSLSPVSPDPHSPRSPLWGSPTKDTENHVDNLLSKSQQLEEEEKEQMEDGQVQEAVRVAEAAAAEMVHVVVVQNGENSVAILESSEEEVKVKTPLHEGSVVVITNGGGDFSHSANGLVDSAEVVVSMKSEPALSLDTSEAEPRGRVPDVSLNEEEEEEGEEEEGTLVIRAECVMITDEGEEAPEDVAPKQEEQETEESPLLDPEETTEEEMTKPEWAPEDLAQPEGSEPSAEEQPRTQDGDAADAVNPSEPEDPTSAHSAATGLEGAAVACVPVYSETEPSTVAPVVEVEAAAAAASAEGAQDPATESGRFQEVPLADPLENQRTQAGQGEQQGEREPLLAQAAAPITQVEPEEEAAAAAAVNTETYSPNRASKGEEPTAPKRKTCQCCSIM